MTNHLHSSCYLNLNDPMEGRFTYDPQLSRHIVEALKGQKNKTYICSLSRNFNNNLMWAMYADGHRGCCIEVEVTTKTWKEIDVTYSEQQLNIDGQSSIEDVLRIKSKQWEHEEETRFIRTLKTSQTNNHLSVKIKKIWLGNKLKRDEVSFYKRLIHKINKDIDVEHITIPQLNCGYLS